MDISSKISDLQCSWFKKLYDQNFHEWKLIPIHFINNAFGKNFIFHSNLSFKTSVLQQFLTFYVMILQSWTNISDISHTHSCLGSQFLWLDKYITTDNNYFRFKEFSSHTVNFGNHLFTSEGAVKDWYRIKKKINTPITYFKNVCKFHTQFLKSGNRYQEKTERRLVLYTYIIT